MYGADPSSMGVGWDGLVAWAVRLSEEGSAGERELQKDARARRIVRPSELKTLRKRETNRQDKAAIPSEHRPACFHAMKIDRQEKRKKGGLNSSMGSRLTRARSLQARLCAAAASSSGSCSTRTCVPSTLRSTRTAPLRTPAHGATTASWGSRYLEVLPPPRVWLFTVEQGDARRADNHKIARYKI